MNPGACERWNERGRLEEPPPFLHSTVACGALDQPRPSLGYWRFKGVPTVTVPLVRSGRKIP